MTSALDILVRYGAAGAELNAATARPTGWIAAGEVRELAALRNPARRTQWLWGRWIAKQLVRQATGVRDFAEIEIQTRDERGLGMAPRLKVCGSSLDWSLSISHTAHGALAALARESQTCVGVDLASDVPTSDQFHQLWFTERERRWLKSSPAGSSNIVWSLKEAIFKACGAGEAWTPRQVEIKPAKFELDGAPQFACSYRGRPLADLCVQVRQLDDQVGAIVSLPRDRRSTPSRMREVATSRKLVVPVEETAPFNVQSPQSRATGASAASWMDSCSPEAHPR